MVARLNGFGAEMSAGFDQDALIAAADLVGRSGASHFEVGYLHDEVPFDEAGWYAHAQFKGVLIRFPEDEESTAVRGPIEAAEGLARRLFAGAQCRRCGELIWLSDGEGGCRWRRMGDRWEPGCDKPVDVSIPRAR